MSSIIRGRSRIHCRTLRSTLHKHHSLRFSSVRSLRIVRHPLCDIGFLQEQRERILIADNHVVNRRPARLSNLTKGAWQQLTTVATFHGAYASGGRRDNYCISGSSCYWSWQPDLRREPLLTYNEYCFEGVTFSMQTSLIHSLRRWSRIKEAWWSRLHSSKLYAACYFAKIKATKNGKRKARQAKPFFYLTFVLLLPFFVLFCFFVFFRERFICFAFLALFPVVFIFVVCTNYLSIFVLLWWLTSCHVMS